MTIQKPAYSPATFMNKVSLVPLLGKDDTSTAFSTNYVIAFARARTNHINTWLNRQLDTMRSASRDSQALNDALAGLARYSEGFNSQVSLDACKAALTDAIEQLPENSPLREKLTTLRDDPTSRLNVCGNGGADAQVTKEEMSSITKDIENDLKAIDRGSQEAQLYINQKMGEKNEILQLAAMMIQQFNETAKAMLQRS